MIHIEEKVQMNAMTKAENRQGAQPEVAGYLTPRVDITETREGYGLKAEMPGVDKSGLELVLDGSELTIVGRKTVPSPSLECVYRESSALSYRRKFELDPAIDTSKVTARMEQGVLLLHLPKAERVKPRKVTVTD